ncbi:MAG: copper-binding protein [Pseudomonadota bacterium]
MNTSHIAATLCALTLAGTPVLAEEKMDHSGHGKMEHGGHQDHSGHGEMKAVDVKPGTEAAGVAVINTVDAEKGMVNLTHEPMPKLGWPTMTMDLPVTRRVDLSDVKPGDKVDFTLKLGRDKQYRVTDMAPSK